MAALHERLVFDTAHGAVLDETRRYVLLRADVLMGLFDALPARAREEALRAFGRSVASRGSDSVRAYAARVDADALPALMESAAASLGWGAWTFDRVARRDGDGDAEPVLRLSVDNSPFAAATARSGTPACHAIAGMLEGLAAALWQRPATAREIECRAQRGEGRCRFVALPADRSRSDFNPTQETVS